MEYVLAVKTALIEKYLTSNGVISGCCDEILDIIKERHEFLPRPEAEEDPSFRQIIPYVVIRRAEEVFCTRRLSRGGEARLHGLISLGVGGHINPVDENGDDPFRAGMEREINEEVEITGESFAPKLIGIISDSSNEVGKVHLGLLFSMEVTGEVHVRETDKLRGSWLPAGALKEVYAEMETWSQIASEVI